MVNLITFLPATPTIYILITCLLLSSGLGQCHKALAHAPKHLLVKVLLPTSSQHNNCPTMSCRVLLAEIWMVVLAGLNLEKSAINELIFFCFKVKLFCLGSSHANRIYIMWIFCCASEHKILNLFLLTKFKQTNKLRITTGNMLLDAVWLTN